jgi:hypothetical protein
MPSITSANATFMMTVGTIFPTPQQIQNFGSDDVTDTDEMEISQVLMGVDGNLSGGFVFVGVKQSIMLMADSPSIDLFDQWYLGQLANLTTYNSNATLQFDVGTKWTLTKGFLTGYKPIPQAKKLLQPQRFGITWQSVSPSPSN